MNRSLAHHAVTRDFMYMTKYTTPHGTEDMTFDKMLLPRGFAKQPSGNYFGTILGDSPFSTTLFVAHLDTADHQRRRVRRDVHDQFVSTDGKSILGADDKAGCAILLHLWRNKVPGDYLFVVGEEVGRVGSLIFNEKLSPYEYCRAVCWDRFGESSIVTHQLGERGCSDEFAEGLIEAYSTVGMREMEIDTSGVYTDSYSFFDNIPECVNIAAGYEGHHTTYEIQNMKFLVDIAEASSKICWDNLPTLINLHEPREVEWGSWQPHHQVSRSKGVYDSHYDWYAADDSIDDLESLEIGAKYGTLTKNEVYDFVYTNPEGAARLLYEKLSGL